MGIHQQAHNLIFEIGLEIGGEVDLHRRVATGFVQLGAKSSALVHGMATCGAKGSVRRRVGWAVGTRLLEAAHRHATGSVLAKMELALTMQPMAREGCRICRMQVTIVWFLWAAWRPRAQGDDGRKAQGRWPGMGWLPIKADPWHSLAPAAVMCQ